ncbi:nucleotidyl transferase AbiEii/AbiGii toxin family protein [Desulfonema limicola]|uniref:nucleotidyl transferase AbiEii/AbiGii toxin family protein n=1 Tax=Desulfonema limicola TaxID=45656 RepID=UPI001A9AD9D6|nr:nucleotidyl transferase AbiEii/AbiGii toxin family protein [Desulfonema limicola]
MKKLNTPFYLTGGTALSRGYFHHRYSDDLDLFISQCSDYGSHVQALFRELETCCLSGEFSIDYRRIQKYEHFTQLFLQKEKKDGLVELKIDLINDIAVHYGGFNEDSLLGTIDSWQNILSNKLAAVFRYEAKDIVDIWVIAKNKIFNWMSVMEQAKTKEAAVDPVVIFHILKSFPEHLLEDIKWVIPVDCKLFKQELSQAADDILRGNDNSLKK